MSDTSVFLSTLSPSKSLFARFLWTCVALILIVSIGSGLIYSKLAYDEAIQSASAAQISTSRFAAAAVISTLQPIENEAKRHAGIAWGEVANRWTIREDDLRRMMSRHDVIQQVVVYDQDNKQRLTLARGDRAIKEFVNASLSTSSSSSAAGIEYSGLIYVGNVPHIVLSVRDALSPSVVTRLTLDLRFVGDTLRAALSNDVGAAMVLDDGGAVLAHSDTSVALMRGRIPQTLLNSAWLLSAASKRAKPLTKVEGRSGEPVYIATERIDRLNWNVVAEQSASIAMKPVRGALLWTLGTALFASLLAAGLAWALSVRLTHPVKMLQQSAAALAAGNLSRRLSVDRQDELGALATSFNAMSSELEASHRDLERKVVEKTAALASTNTQLESANKHKSEFLTHMSHELRTPLNAVIGFSDLLKAQYFGPLNTKQSQYVRDINASGQHLLSLINDILDLAKVESGRMELMLSDSRIADLVESCRALVSERVNRARQALTISMSDEVFDWCIDERKVKQCLLNLLTNASKFTPDGGTITLDVALEENALVFKVADTGVGITPEDQAQLFSEFFQTKSRDETTPRASESTAGPASIQSREGTGLGLALTRRFAELHGGTISVSSVVGQGTTFTLQFPWRERT
jgi:signal transduction histidine kinase